MKITRFRVNGQAAPVAETALDGMLLPVPRETDEGKVVTVSENGNYELAEASGSGNLIVTLRYEIDENEHSYMIGDKTWNQIYDAHVAGRTCIVDFRQVPFDRRRPFDFALIDGVGKDEENSGYAVNASQFGGFETSDGTADGFILYRWS